MKAFHSQNSFAPVSRDCTETRFSLHGFDPTEGRLSTMLGVAMRQGGASIMATCTPAEARELAAALLTAADTFEDGANAGAYLVKYIPKVPEYPKIETALGPRRSDAPFLSDMPQAPTNFSERKWGEL